MEIMTSLRGRRFGFSALGDLVLNRGATQRIMPLVNLVNCTAATLTVTADLHAGRIITMNRAGGMTCTLPAATGTGNVYKFFVGTTFTSSGIIVVANATDIIQGGVSVSTDIAGVTCLTTTTADTITMNGTTTGGLKGSWVELTDVAAGLFMCSGFLVSSGAEATPFSATV